MGNCRCKSESHFRLFSFEFQWPPSRVAVVDRPYCICRRFANHQLVSPTWLSKVLIALISKTINSFWQRNRIRHYQNLFEQAFIIIMLMLTKGTFASLYVKSSVTAQISYHENLWQPTEIDCKHDMWIERFLNWMLSPTHFQFKHNSLLFSRSGCFVCWKPNWRIFLAFYLGNEVKILYPNFHGK